MRIKSEIENEVTEKDDSVTWVTFEISHGFYSIYIHFQIQKKKNQAHYI